MPFVLLRPTVQVSDCIGDASSRAIERAAHQLELRDQPVVAFQELITFLGELFVEFFELVDPALQARDVAFERVHGVLIFSVLAPQLGIVFKDFHQIVVITLQFLWHAGVPPSLFVPKKECGFLCVFFGAPSHCRRPHLQY